jgi:hypothetical protein
MRITASGNVGIGNTASVSPDPAPITGKTYLLVGPTATSTLDGALTLCANNTAAASEIGIVNFANYAIAAGEKRIASIQGVLDGATDSGSLRFFTLNLGIIGERMRITAAGNVGIGNTLSVLPVNVTGFPQLVVGPASAVGAGERGIITACSNLTTGIVGSFAFANYAIAAADKRLADIACAVDGATNSGQLRFYLWNAGTLTQPMVITAAGRVGINTATPGATLQVVGPDAVDAVTISPSSNTGKYILFKPEYRSNTAEISYWASTGYGGIQFNGNVGIGGATAGAPLQVREGGDQNIVFSVVGGFTSIQATNDAVNLWVPLQFYATAYYFRNATVDIQNAGSIVMHLQGSAGTTNNNTQVRFFGTQANTDLWAIGTDVVAGNGSTNFHFHDLVTGSVMTLQRSTGNVGINQPSPGAQLHVSTHGSPYYGQILVQDSDRNPGASPSAAVTGCAADGTRTWYLGGAVGHADNMLVWCDAAAAIEFGVGGTERARLGAAGLGINTTNVPDALTLNGMGSSNLACLRMVYGNYGCFFRNDGATWYFMITNSGDQYGGWAAPYPIQIDLASKKTTIAQLDVSGAFRANGGGTIVSLTSAGMALAYSTSAVADYNNAAIQVREYNLGNAFDGNVVYAPRISFHWAGRVASQIGMDGGGWIRTFNNPGTGYERFACSTLYAASSVGILTSTPICSFEVFSPSGPFAPLMSLGAGAGSNAHVGFTGNGAWGLYFGLRDNGDSWIQAGRTDSATAYSMTLQAAGGKVAIGTNSVGPGPLTVYASGYGIRVAHPSYGVDLYNDGGNFYFLLTNVNDPYGGYNGLRPLYINLPTGNVNFGHNVTIGGSLTVGGVAVGGPSIKIQANSADPPFVVPQLNFSNGAQTVFNMGIETGYRANCRYDVASDSCLKQNIATLTGGLSIINQLRPVAFEWNGLGGFEAGRRSVAIIAQELQEVLPDCVYQSATRLRPDDKEQTEILAYDPYHILFHAVLAIQQLEERLKALEARLAN